MDVWFDDITYSDQGIVISEIMANPGSVSDSYGEWFEIVNTTDSTIDLQGWSIKDLDGDEHELVLITIKVFYRPTLEVDSRVGCVHYFKPLTI